MSINTSLLIAAPVLQDAILDDATGLPLVAGVISLFQDASRTTFKNWYYQTGSPGAYTYLPLANPLTLNAAGVITDPNGNDTIPFFYPFSEVDNVTPQPYYITVTDSAGHSKITRQNFPFNPTTSIVNTVNATLENYIVNNIFWRNNAPSGVNLTNVTFASLAPSVHQGIVQNINVAAAPVPITSNPDICFFKSTTGANDTITFSQFQPGQFLSAMNPANLDVTPVYFMNLTCAGTGAETFKIVQFPLTLSLKTMDSMPATFTIWLRCHSGSNVITPRIYQYAGSGGGNGVLSNISMTGTGSITLPVDAQWHKYDIPFSMPSATGISIGPAGDDAIFLQLSYPAGATGVCNIDVAKPSLYVGNQAPTNDMQVNDIEESIFSVPRTGDVRITMNSFSPFGWVPMNDGVISDAGSFTLPSGIGSSRAAKDTWPLFNLLWNIAKPHDTGSNLNPICQMFTSAGAATNFGSSAIADFATNNTQLQLSFTVGRAMLNLPPLLPVTYNRATTPSWNQAGYGSTPQAGVFTSGSGSNFLVYPGAPIFLTGTMPTGGNFTANIIYYAIPDPTGGVTTFQLASSYANALALNAIPAGGASDNGSNIVLNYALGGANGQPTHGQVIPELAAHTHPPPPSATSFQVIGGVGTGNGTAGGALTAIATGSTGNGNAFNIVQPSTYMNMFIKL